MGGVKRINRNVWSEGIWLQQDSRMKAMINLVTASNLTQVDKKMSESAEER